MRSSEDAACIDDDCHVDAACEPMILRGSGGGGGGGGGGGDCGQKDSSAPVSGKLKQFRFNPGVPPVNSSGGGGPKSCCTDDDDWVRARDPDGMNVHCFVKFEDIIAEPDPTVFSFDGVWTISYKVFTSTKLWCYRITSLICAIPAAICWGIEFACLSFCTIWCWQPSLKAYEISLWYTRRLFEIFLNVFFEPCFHAMGKCLSHIVVTVKREG